MFHFLYTVGKLRDKMPVELLKFEALELVALTSHRTASFSYSNS